jgi:hypothetical protein
MASISREGPAGTFTVQTPLVLVVAAAIGSVNCPRLSLAAAMTDTARFARGVPSASPR